MSYQVTVHEADAGRRDDPNSTIYTRRTLATRTTRSGAIETARALLETHAEVTIWNDSPGSGKIIDRWLPPKTIILSEPRLLGTILRVTPWPTHYPAHPGKGMKKLRGTASQVPTLVNRHFYEYTASNGRKVNFVFETLLNQAPQVPRFGTQAAIERFCRQWEHLNCPVTMEVLTITQGK
jgi:hypothetical protein